MPDPGSPPLGGRPSRERRAPARLGGTFFTTKVTKTTKEDGEGSRSGTEGRRTRMRLWRLLSVRLPGVLSSRKGLRCMPDADRRWTKWTTRTAGPRGAPPARRLKLRKEAGSVPISLYHPDQRHLLLSDPVHRRVQSLNDLGGFHPRLERPGQPFLVA